MKISTTQIVQALAVHGGTIIFELAAPHGNLKGNVTGVSQSNEEVTPKRLELMHEVLPNAKVMALLINRADMLTKTIDAVRSAAQRLGVELHVLDAGTDPAVEAAFTTLSQVRADGLVIGGGPFFASRITRLAALAVQHRLPTCYQRRAFTVAGGLLAYGSEITDAYRLAGVYVGRILRGATPAELPIQQAAKVELHVNLKTAKALGITIPLAILLRADEVIE
jgi:putative ABC transport system substrate-binding protein